jgi:glycosidase
VRDFQDLVAAVHQRGMKLILDVVINHTGPHHPWLDDPPAPDRFHGTREHHSISSGTFGPLTDPHALPVEKLKNAFSLLPILRGIPQIYSGDEIAMPGGDDPNNRSDFPGGFPGDPHNAFTSAGRSPAEQEVFAHVQALLRLRKQHPALREGRQSHLDYDDPSYVFLREEDTDHVLVVFNNGPAGRSLEIDLSTSRLQDVRSAELLLGAPPATIQNTKLTVEAPPHTVSIYSLH